MAAGGKDNFSSWLSGYLSERGIDVDVYLEYICGIVSASGEDEEEDLISSLEEVLSGAVVSVCSTSKILLCYAFALYPTIYLTQTARWARREGRIRWEKRGGLGKSRGGERVCST